MPAAPEVPPVAEVSGTPEAAASDVTRDVQGNPGLCGEGVPTVTGAPEATVVPGGQGVQTGSGNVQHNTFNNITQQAPPAPSQVVVGNIPQQPATSSC
jgi:hypothetical protein